MTHFIVISLGVLTGVVSPGAWKAQTGSDATDGTRAAPGAPRIVVVVSPKNPINSLTAAELERILLRKTSLWPNGQAITVYERPVKTTIRRAFSEKVLKKEPEALREYWMNLKLTRGLKPPKVLRSEKLIKRYLERVGGGICYLYEDEVDETVKAVKIVWSDGS